MRLLVMSIFSQKNEDALPQEEAGLERCERCTFFFVTAFRTWGTADYNGGRCGGQLGK